ncbi:hypothetical protein TELCIR_19830, partial [Teladorsagia circumcincta]
NELGSEPTRRVALSRHTCDGPLEAHECESWMREHTAAEAGILEDVSNVYLGGRLCAARQPKNVIEPQDIGSYYYRHCFAGREMNWEASRHDGWPSLDTHVMVHWKHTNVKHTAAEAGILEDVSNVYLGGRLCAARQPKNVIEPQDIGSYYYRHCFAGR